MRTSRIIATVFMVASLIVGACAKSPEAATKPEITPEPNTAPALALKPQELGTDRFITSNLKLPTMEESSGDAMIEVTVTNTGTLEKTRNVELMVNGYVVATKEVILAGGASRNVAFTTTLSSGGTYAIKIDQVTGTLNWVRPN